MKKILLSLLTICCSFLVNAQPQTVNTTDVMNTHGKIYVVMVVVLIILFGLLGYVFSLDRKISKLEKNHLP